MPESQTALLNQGEARGAEPVLRKYAALLSYVGTSYCGWQRQAGTDSGTDPSIQATVEDALERMTGEKASVVGSGRTDSGVHALGQCAHFTLKKGRDWQPEILKRGLNSNLPPNIQALWVRSVPIDFHAQRSAERKQYSYYFQQGGAALPHLKAYSFWVRKSLDVVAMQRALDHLKGEHDFKPFQASGSVVLKSTVRTILEAEIGPAPIGFPGVSPEGVHLVRMRLVGTGFLKQMVRGIAGTILQVGEGKRDPDSLRVILETRDRKSIGQTSPGRGLWLERVWYPERYGVG